MLGHGHHDHHHHSDVDQRSSRNLLFALLLNVGFVGFEIVGGIRTNSVAILADAVHDASDALSLGLAWYLQRLSQRGADKLFTYGYRRFSVLGALITGVLLVSGLALVMWRAIERLQEPEPVHSLGMLGLAVIGILVNGAAFLRLYKGSSLNEQVVGWHLLEDVLGWVAVLIGAAVMAVADWPIIDPLLSLMIGALILFNVFGKLRRVALVFLQSVPEGFDLERFTAEVLRLPLVLSTHHTHVWTLDGERHVLTMHVVLAPSAQRSDIVHLRTTIIEMLRNQGVEHATIAFELEGEPCDGSVNADARKPCSDAQAT